MSSPDLLIGSLQMLMKTVPMQHCFHCKKQSGEETTAIVLYEPYKPVPLIVPQTGPRPHKTALKSCKEFEWTLHTYFWIGIGRIVTLLPYMLSANPTLTFNQLRINNVVVIITWNGQESIAKWKHRSKREPGLQALYNILLEFTNCDQSSPIVKQQLTELRIQQWLKTTTATSIAHPFFHWPPKQVSLHWAPNTLLSAGFEIDSPWNPGIFWWSCRNEVLSNGAWFPPVPRHVLDLLEQLRRTGWHTQPDEDQRTPGSSCSFSSSKKIIVPLHWCCCSIASTHDLFI